MAIRRAYGNIAGVGIAFGSVTGSYQDLGTAKSKIVCLIIINSLNQPVTLSLTGASSATDTIVLPIGSTGAVVPNTILTIPFGSLGTEWSGTIAIKHNGAAPTAGRLDVSFIGVD